MAFFYVESRAIVRINKLSTWFGIRDCAKQECVKIVVFNIICIGC